MTSAEQNPNEISSVVCCLGDFEFTLSKVLIQGEGRYRADGVTHSKVSNIFSHSINNTGSFISQTYRQYWGFDIFVVAPH